MTSSSANDVHVKDSAEEDINFMSKSGTDGKASLLRCTVHRGPAPGVACTPCKASNTLVNKPRNRRMGALNRNTSSDSSADDANIQARVSMVRPKKKEVAMNNARTSSA
eukprot:GHVH01006735.1.p1 GENE.GHVH01006735.1~~GHVH01006735.1.p1  ORF type:complete len:109 (-),score=11.98 GHVH01006735.1:248-574(-)